MHSSFSKTEPTESGFSKLSLHQSTFSATEPPLTWISMRWAFFCCRPVLDSCEWARTRTTVQYFLIRSSSRVIDCPLFSECFLAYRVKAFFFDRYQFLPDVSWV